MKNIKFLSAHWKNLIMVNYEISPGILKDYIPAGVELDLFEGKCLVSLVAFQFKETKVLGMEIPFHVHFSEINLRFYIRELVNDEWVRGVIFVKEFVPKSMVALVANTLFHENYKKIDIDYNSNLSEDIIEESYDFEGNNIRILAQNTPKSLSENSIEEFITEHYFGYTLVDKSTTFKYRVEHPSWEILPILDSEVKVDFPKLYGAKFKVLNFTKIHSVLLAKGSDISVYNKEFITHE